MDKKNEFGQVKARRRYGLISPPYITYRFKQEGKSLECHLPRVDNFQNLLIAAVVVPPNAKSKQIISMTISSLQRTAIRDSYSSCNRWRTRSALVC